MATNMDKAFYQAPQGLDQLSEQEEPIEIEIEDPEAVRINAGDFTLEMTKEEDEDEFEKNLAEEMTEGELATIAGDLVGDFDTDISSRKDWVQTYVDGLELLGMKLEDRTEPWPGACGVYHPLLTESVVKFQAKKSGSTKLDSLMELLPYLKLYNGEAFVIYCDGKILYDEELLSAFAHDVVLMRELGIHIFIIVLCSSNNLLSFYIVSIYYNCNIL